MGTTGPGKPVVSAAPCRLGQADQLETLSLQLSYQQLVDFWSVTDRACVPAAHHHRAQLIGFSQVQSQSPCLPRNLLQGPIDQQFGHMEAGYNLYKQQHFTHLPAPLAELLLGILATTGLWAMKDFLKVVIMMLANLSQDNFPTI